MVTFNRAPNVRVYNRNLTKKNSQSEGEQQNAIKNVYRQLNKYGYNSANAQSSNIVTRVAMREEAEEAAKDRGVSSLPSNRGSRHLIPSFTRNNRVKHMLAPPAAGGRRATRKARRRRL